MKIIGISENANLLKSIPIGDTFYTCNNFPHKHNIFIRTDKIDKDVNIYCVNLNDGTLAVFDENLAVIPIKLEAHLL